MVRTQDGWQCRGAWRQQAGVWGLALNSLLQLMKLLRLFANQSKHKLVYQIPLNLKESRKLDLVACAVRIHKIKLEMTECFCHPTAAKGVLKFCF